ncbi:MAG TPA: PfkB family carbohydrate kinase [Chitinophagales bacterium]|nr:PfkB family carbohydrate kinase [Chitinophagales bacterium]HNE45566.1 PfkB family carbohydrate kinase [Chitinophagales bacterium]HNF67765.1 PfkB family carbohydrate kinase [Chitinophagales bacterium]HNI55182.1 PfkB family carbohydrate kinase [Chitinophagales bacterium]HNJ90239.1 PfkB family carbohydrate kinase [Chitinophagales bacterium]
MSLLVVGTVAFDAIETPFGKRDKVIGGSATYIGLSASYYYKPIHIVSVVGSDFPKATLAAFNKKGITTDGVQVIKGQKSFFWSGKYHMDMNSRDTLRTDLNVLADFNPVLPEKLRKPNMLMLGNIDPNLQIRVIEQLKSRPKLIAMDTMNFWMDIARPALDKVLKMVDVLIINDEEARQLTGEYSVVKAAKKIMKNGPKTLIIKKGEHGALLFSGSEVFFAPALPLEEVFDPTGAGDTFAGGFMGYLSQSKTLSFTNMKGAIVYGSAMASFCVEEFGPEKLLALKKPEIAKRVKMFSTLSKFSIKG